MKSICKEENVNFFEFFNQFVILAYLRISIKTFITIIQTVKFFLILGSFNMMLTKS